MGESKHSRRLALEHSCCDENVFRAVPRVVADQEACEDKDTSLQCERENGILQGRADDRIGKETGGRVEGVLENRIVVLGGGVTQTGVRGSRVSGSGWGEGEKMIVPLNSLGRGGVSTTSAPNRSGDINPRI